MKQTDDKRDMLGATQREGTPKNAYLFDQERSHKWHDALDNLESSREPTMVALAKNWRIDPRIDAERERNLVANPCFPSGYSKRSSFVAATTDYLARYHCRPETGSPPPDYASGANKSNAVPLNKAPSKSCELLHMASIKTLLFRALKSADFKMAMMRITGTMSIPEATTPGVHHLVEVLLKRGLGSIAEFANALSRGLGETEPHWWATFATDVPDLPNGGYWTEAVRKTGTAEFKDNEWLVAWKYTVELAGQLYRPTVAEAGRYAFHFPSPPNSLYGIAMPLAENMTCAREVIHAPLKGDFSARSCLGFGRVGNPYSLPPGSDKNTRLRKWFESRRREHSHTLAAIVTNQDETIDWLNRHGLRK